MMQSNIRSSEISLPPASIMATRSAVEATVRLRSVSVSYTHLDVSKRQTRPRTSTNVIIIAESLVAFENFTVIPPFSDLF